MLRHEGSKQAQALSQFRKQLFEPGGLFGRCQRISPWAFGVGAAWGQAPPGATATATTASTVLLLPSKRSTVQPHGYTWAPEVVLGLNRRGSGRKLETHPRLFLPRSSVARPLGPEILRDRFQELPKISLLVLQRPWLCHAVP